MVALAILYAFFVFLVGVNTGAWVTVPLSAAVCTFAYSAFSRPQGLKRWLRGSDDGGALAGLAIHFLSAAIFLFSVGRMVSVLT